MAFFRLANLCDVGLKYFLPIAPATFERSMCYCVRCILLFSRPIKMLWIDAKPRTACMSRFQLFFWFTMRGQANKPMCVNVSFLAVLTQTVRWIPAAFSDSKRPIYTIICVAGKNSSNKGGARTVAHAIAPIHPPVIAGLDLITSFCVFSFAPMTPYRNESAPCEAQS